MVLTNIIYTPQTFVELLTEKCYVFNSDNDIADIHKFLIDNNIETDDCPLWDYPLCEIEHIVENGSNVVLVEIAYFNQNDEFCKECRWFEVPEEYADKFKED